MKNIKTRAISLVLAMLLIFGTMPIGAEEMGIQDNMPTSEELSLKETTEEPGQEFAGLTSLKVRSGSSTTNDDNLLVGEENQVEIPVFTQGQKEYTLKTHGDNQKALYFWYTIPMAGCTVTLNWGADKSEIYTTVEESGVKLEYSKEYSYCLLPGKNAVTLTVTPPKDSLAEPVVYTFNMDIIPTLKGLSIADGAQPIFLDKPFSATETEYTVIINDSTTSLAVTAVPTGAYNVTYNGSSESNVDISTTDKIDVVVTAAKDDKQTVKTYTINLVKKAPYDATILATPQDAVIKVYDAGGNEIFLQDGKYKGLLPEAAYRYTVVKSGYITATGNIINESLISVELVEAAPPASALPSYTGDWISFRGNAENMGITESKTPKNSGEAYLKWSKKYGTGWTAAPTPPIIVNGNLYSAVNDQILKLDKITGAEIKRSGKLVSSVGFAMNPITYGDGMIFVQVSDGRIQALRADTLESLWVSEKLGGQTLSPITYKDGHVYCGTWSSETTAGAYFAISTTDEYTENATEEKKISWKITHNGGFSWTGAYVTDKYAIFGSDDGSSEGTHTETAVLYSANPITGEILDKVEGIKGDIRSTIAYDKTSDRIFFTSKGGMLYSLKVKTDGTFDKDSLKQMDLGGPSTGTPLVYNGVVFVGSAGKNQFDPDGAAYHIIDADKMTSITKATIPGYVQSSALLSTAYAEETQKVYIYTTYNAKPGGIHVIEYDMAGKTAISSALFTPKATLDNYCISSIVCDSDGTLYYKNDSNNVMVIGQSDKQFMMTEASATRKDGETATVSYTSQRAGKVHYKIVEEDAIAPTEIDKSTTSAVMTVGSNSISLRNIADNNAKDIYLVAVDGNGNVSEPVKVALPAFVPPVPEVSGIEIVVSVEAFTIGGGYIVKPVVVKPFKGENGAQVLDRVLKSSGFEYTKTGKLENGFYLSSIDGTKLAGLNLPTDGTMVPEIIKKSIDRIGTRDADSLGEFDFTSMSGWKYSAQGDFPPYGFSDYTPADGDVMRVQFTLAYGADLGDTMGEPMFKAANKDELTALLAAHGFEKCPKSVLDIVYKVDASTVEVEQAVKDFKAAVESSKPPVIVPEEAKPAIDADLSNAAAEFDTKTVNGQSVSVDFTAKADGAINIKVKAGSAEIDKLSGGLVVKLPTKNNSSSVVALLVKADGTTEVIKKSYTADGQLIIPLEGSATVKIINNHKEFKDIASSFWASDAIEFVAARDLLTGVEKDGFAPNSKMTRGMAVTVLHRLENLAKAATKQEFTDIDSHMYYAPSVDWAAEYKIANGMGTSFAPNDEISREQLAVMMYNYIGVFGKREIGEKTELTFVDSDKVSTWAKDAMDWAISNKIFAGKENGVLDPKGSATRAEVATILQRLLVVLK